MQHPHAEEVAQRWSHLILVGSPQAQAAVSRFLDPAGKRFCLSLQSNGGAARGPVIALTATTAEHAARKAPAPLVAAGGMRQGKLPWEQFGTTLRRARRCVRREARLGCRAYTAPGQPRHRHVRPRAHGCRLHVLRRGRRGRVSAQRRSAPHPSRTSLVARHACNPRTSQIGEAPSG